MNKQQYFKMLLTASKKADNRHDRRLIGHYIGNEYHRLMWVGDDEIVFATIDEAEQAFIHWRDTVIWELDNKPSTVTLNLKELINEN